MRKMGTSNIERRTLNIEYGVQPLFIRRSAFSVRYSMFPLNP
jgi:hypothetical protein